MKHKALLYAIKNRKSGVRDRRKKLISEPVMAEAEKAFWPKRGFEHPPGVTSGGVMR